MHLNGLFYNLDLMNLLIFSATNSPRLSYILKFIFNDFFDSTFELTNDIELFRNSKKNRLNYSHRKIEGCFTITPHTLLFEDKIHLTGPKLVINDDLIALEHSTSNKANFPTDPFAFCFYCLSRYEEYLPFGPDQFNRFTAKQSTLFQFGYLDIPVVDKWLFKLKKKIEAYFPDDRLNKKQEYKVFPTVDVDIPWFLKHRSRASNFKTLTKSLVHFDLKAFRTKWNTINGKLPDPYDTYSAFKEKFQNFPSSIFFLLVGNTDEIDTNFAVQTEEFQELVSQIKDDFRIGLHPSSYSNQHFEVLKEEYKYLATLIESSPVASRQHYIKLRFPETYRRLNELGIKKDFSMGFPDASGFRAGTSHSFNWFDLSRNRATSLKIYPFFTMDVTLRKYEYLDEKQAVKRVNQLKRNIKDVEGIACFIWHNSSLSEIEQWKNWSIVLDTLIEN